MPRERGRVGNRKEGIGHRCRKRDPGGSSENIWQCLLFQKGIQEVNEFHKEVLCLEVRGSFGAKVGLTAVEPATTELLVPREADHPGELIKLKSRHLTFTICLLLLFTAK